MKKFFHGSVLLIAVLFGLFSSSAFAQDSTTITWSTEKEAVYEPLLPNTLSWSDDVMKSGGYDFDAEKVVSSGSAADFVMNGLMDIGARKILKVDSFGEPLPRNSIVFPKDGLGYLIQSFEMADGDVFLIEGSNGKYAQVRVDRITTNQAVFTYVLEAKSPEVEDIVPEDPQHQPTSQSTLPDYKQLEKKYIQDSQKVWTVSFNTAIDPATVNEHTIYVMADYGYILPTGLSVSSDNKKVFITPLESYKNSEEYTIYITDEVQSAKGRSITQGTLMPFSLDPTESPSNASESGTNPTTPAQGNADQSLDFSSYFGEWTLETSLASFGILGVYEDGSFIWVGGPSGDTIGNWIESDYGLVLIKADGQYDYVIGQSDRNPEQIKLMYVDGQYTDGSPMLFYFSEGKQ